MIFKRQVLLLVVAFIILALANAARNECPKVAVMANFSAASFSGRWYDIKRTKTPIDAFRGSCASVNFTVNSKQNITISMSTKISGRVVNTQNAVLMNSNGVLDWNFNVGPGEKTIF